VVDADHRLRGPLIDDLDLLDWSDSIKAMQRNWIGRSEGARVDFSSRPRGPITVFTTRPDTWFGATLMVLAPERPARVRTDHADRADGGRVVRAGRAVEERGGAPRATDRTKSGVFTGGHATNPGNGEQSPVWSPTTC
jgi:leucyl-tRNA synthetase